MGLGLWMMAVALVADAVWSPAAGTVGFWGLLGCWGLGLTLVVVASLFE